MKFKSLVQKFSYIKLLELSKNKCWKIPSSKDIIDQDIDHEEFWVSDLPEKQDRQTHAHVYNKKLPQVLQIANKHFLLNAVVMVKEKTCEWKYVEDSFFDGHWHTSCGNDFAMINDDTPKDNKFKFCCYCGKKIKETK